MPKIIWLSRHKPTARQRVALGAAFPDHQLVVDSRAFDGADDIVKRFRECGADELVVVAPLSVVRAIIRRGVKPLFAEMIDVPCTSPLAEVRLKNRCLRFVGFHRVEGVELKLTPITPAPTGAPKGATT